MILIKKQQGVTLLEVLLVLAIAGVIIISSFEIYQTYSADQNVNSVKAQVETLFTALANYHKANCNDKRDASGLIITIGALSPSSITYPPTAPRVINIATELRGGEANAFLDNLPVFNPLIDTTVGTNGYIVQFNPINPGPSNTPGGMNTYACWNFGGSTPTNYNMGPYTTANVVCSGDVTQPSVPTAQLIPLSRVIIWQVQVAVKLLDGLDANLYQNLMAANCTSRPQPGGRIAPCSANLPGQYLVWERLPSQASSKTASGYWYTKPLLDQFNRQYSHDQMYELYFPAFTTAWPNTTTINPYVSSPPYYLCGG